MHLIINKNNIVNILCVCYLLIQINNKHDSINTSIGHL